MAKTHSSKMIIGVTLLLAVIAAVLVFNPTTGAIGSSPRYTGRAEYQRFEMQQSPQEAGFQGGEALSRANCFSAAYHAASDCDRLASSITAANLSSPGPGTNSCFSSAYHAASDCDRLASGGTLVRLPSTGPTSSACFSVAFHAASDCDRIASEVNVASAKP